MPCLTIAHNIFINQEQRYSLSKKAPCFIEVIGFNNPVWTGNLGTTEPAEEIFCKYRITNIKDKDVVKIVDNGYQIHINSLKDRLRLRDTKDLGSESLMMTYNKKMISETGKPFLSVHFISINDWIALERSLEY